MHRLMLMILGLMAWQRTASGTYFTTSNCATNNGKAPKIERVGEFRQGTYYDSGGVEVLTYSNYKGAALVAVVESNEVSSGVRLLDVTDITKPKEISFINITTSYGFPNSVGFYNNVLAVACDSPGNRTDPGFVLLYTLDISVNKFKRTQSVQVKEPRAIRLSSAGKICAVPDMLIWSKKGDKIYTACEGEPSTQNDEDLGSDPNVGPNPAGAIGVVSVKWGRAANSIADARVTNIISIQAYLDTLSETKYEKMLKNGLQIDWRIKNKSVAAKDIEPEYIAMSDDGSTLYCTLQENNAILVVDTCKEKIKAIWPLGFKDWSKNTIDISDKSKTVDMKSWANLKGLYQPDTIVYKKIHGRGYLFLANEGDSKEDKVRIGSLKANTTNLFPDTLKAADQMGRLNVNPSCGLKDRTKGPDGGYDFLCSYGGRSFSILDAETGDLVFESGDEFEKKILELKPSCFNCDRDANTLKVRSDDSGPEPEAIEVMELNGRFYALIGLERQSGFMIYDVTNPSKATFVQWWVYRDFNPDLSFKNSNAAIMGDMAPEMIKFIPANKSHTRKPFLMVTNEFSASVTFHTVAPCQKPVCIKGVRPRL